MPWRYRRQPQDVCLPGYPPWLAAPTRSRNQVRSLIRDSATACSRLCTRHRICDRRRRSHIRTASHVERGRRMAWSGASTRNMSEPRRIGVHGVPLRWRMERPWCSRWLQVCRRREDHDREVVPRHFCQVESVRALPRRSGEIRCRATQGTGMLLLWPNASSIPVMRGRCSAHLQPLHQ